MSERENQLKVMKESIESQITELKKEKSAIKKRIKELQDKAIEIYKKQELEKNKE